MEIRQYREADWSAVVRLWDTVFPDPAPHNDPADAIDRKLAHNDQLFFVAVTDAGVIGTVLGGFDGHRGWAYSLAVHPDHRRQGIGSKLMRSLEKELARRGCPKLNLQVRGNNQAVAFYEKIGYEVEERISMGKRMAST